jgi:dTDP-4-dehydrorhamnose reductase
MYASSKLLGEWFAADASPWYVLRVESLFGQAPGAPPGGRTVGAIMQRLRQGEEVRVFKDRTVSPTYVIDAAIATRQLVERGAASGLYHCVNSGRCTWLEMASELAALLGIEARLVPIRMADVTLRAARPQYCALSNEKLRAAGIDMPTWQDAVRRFVADGDGVI